MNFPIEPKGLLIEEMCRLDRLFSPRHIAAFAVVLLTGCVVSPAGYIGGDSIPRGRALGAGDNFVIFVSLKLANADFGEKDDGARPLRRPELVQEEFVSGFHSVVPHAKAFYADEAIRRACFDTEARSRGRHRAVVLDPALSDPRCQAAMRQRAVRYVVSITGWAQTEMSEEWGRTGRGSSSIELLARNYHTFHVDVRTFAVEGVLPVCEDSASESATTESSSGVLFIGIPVPYFASTMVDEDAFIKRTAWRAGARTASCFLPVPAPR